MTNEEYSMISRLKVFQKINFENYVRFFTSFFWGTAGLVFLGGLTDIKL